MTKRREKLGLKKHMMTGISYMIPVVVAGGLLMALGKATGGWDVGDKEGTIPYMINSLGAAARVFVVPVLTAGISYSIAERPGIAPGLILGYMAHSSKAGFLGGLIVGVVVGYFINWIKTWKVPKWAQGLLPVMIIPFVSSLIIGMLFLLVISKPIIWLTASLTEWMMTLNGGSKFIMGAVIGACMGFDMGGPVNKTASAVANGLGAEGVYGPMSAKIVGGMTPPLGIGLAVLIAPKKFSKTEVETAKAAVPMGLSFITEGVLPFAAADPLRVIPSTMIGAAIAGGLSMLWGVESVAGHGGIFIVPQMTNPLYFLLALLIGSLVTAFIYAFIKKEPMEDDLEEEIIDLDIEIKM